MKMSPSKNYLDKIRLNMDKLLIPTDYVVIPDRLQQQILALFHYENLQDLKILDLNPGSGSIYSIFLNDGVIYEVLENNPDLAAELEQHGFKVLSWDIPKIPAPENNYNCVLSYAFLEHLPTYLDAVKLLLEVRRVLVAGGDFMLIAPNYSALKNVFFDDYKHNWIITEERMRQMLSDCGFVVKDVKFTIGWLTIKVNILLHFTGAMLNFAIMVMRWRIFQKIARLSKLEKFVLKFNKTFFELMIITAEKSK